jgi:uncharacterized protein YndB with AHSA1/START domain
MPTARRQRTLSAPPERVWELIADPHHLPRWWPGVRRVEDVREETWTQVLYTRKGRPVRVDMRLVADEPPRLRSWEQEVGGTPFERVLAESVIEVLIEPSAGGSEVTVEQRQQLKGYSRTGGWMLRRATRRKLDEALDGLSRIAG